MSAQDDFRKRTLARLESVKSHLDTAPRASRLKDKVCIITGAGSLKGIGHVSFMHFTFPRPLPTSPLDAPQPFSLLTKVSIFPSNSVGAFRV